MSQDMETVLSLLEVNITTISTISTTSSDLQSGRVAPPDNAEALNVVRYAVQKVCVPVVVALGVVGNILNMLVLTRRSMTNSTNCYLTALAAFDTLYLIFSLTLSFKHYDGFHRSTVYVHWFPYGRVLTDMAANVSVLLTVTFTVERYIGVCHPMRGRVLCTPRRAKLIIGLVALVAVSCTVPEFFEMEVVWRRDKITNESYAAWQYTDFSETYSYQIGYYWFFVTVFTFLPLILLCIFNGILIASLFKAAQLRSQMTMSMTSPRRVSERCSREQQWITKMLVTVVLVFIVCQLPGAVLLLLWAYAELANVQMSAYARNQMLIAGNVTNLLIQINASINFILYSMTSTKFRRVFCRTICEMAVHSPPVNRSSTFKNDFIPMTSVYSASLRHGSLESGAAPMRIRLMNQNGTNHYGRFNASKTRDKDSPTTETYLLEGDREL
nr:hypothetical protein BaRGS_027058 [Batillaria attramentaria]